jgi:hypothetical protein
MLNEISEHEKKLARHPHELFLINLITNHILLFAAALGTATSHPFIMLPIPLFSASVLTYTLWRASRSLKVDPWFAKCHWQIAARRSKLLLGLVAVISGIVALIFLVAGGNPKPGHWAMLGATVLPTMVTILALIILETDSLQQARHGMVPAWIRERFPNAEAQPVTV